MNVINEIEKLLGPCPFCGSRVQMTYIESDVDGCVRAEFHCPTCDYDLTLERVPGSLIPRKRLQPWEQWNHRAQKPWR